jgi:acetyl-CoA acetyltransferase
MNDVYVIGVGMTPFAKHGETTAIELGARALRQAIEDAGLGPTDVEAMYAGHVYGGMVAGERVAAECGLAGIPIINVENACASGTTAVIEAVHAIRAGRYRCIAASGFEKISDRPGMLTPEESDYEGQLGLVFPAWHAMRARLYMEEFGLTREQLALVAVKAHHNGSLNPLAQVRDEITVSDVIESRPIASPLNLLDCCPKGDGGAAVILGSRDYAREHARRRGRVTKIAGVGLYSGRPDGVYSPLFEDVTSRAARDAFAESGVTPKDVDFAEVHDCFTIAEGFRVEGLGLCDPGTYFRELAEGRWAVDGEVPVNPSGGLLAKGHPLGATGVAQLCEVTEQFRGVAGGRQVGKADVAVAHTRGGSVPGTEGGSCGVLVCIAEE